MQNNKEIPGKKSIRRTGSPARRSRLRVICCTRGSGPWGRLQCDQGSVWPGGMLRPWAQKIVAALNTKFPLGPG